LLRQERDVQKGGHPSPGRRIRRMLPRGGTLVERTTRFALLLHLPAMSGHGTKPRQKNGPALAGYGAVRDAITKTKQGLPEHLRKSLIWDQGRKGLNTGN